MEFFNENWPFIVVGIGVLIKFINVTTKHFSEYKGLTKVLLYVVDILDIVKVTKVTKPTKKNSILALFLLFACLSASGCAGWLSNAKDAGVGLKDCMAKCASSCAVEALQDMTCSVPDAK